MGSSFGILDGEEVCFVLEHELATNQMDVIKGVFDSLEEDHWC